MTSSITIDWKCVVALGASAIGVILALKVNPDASEQVLTQAVSTCKEYALAKSER